MRAEIDWNAIAVSARAEAGLELEPGRVRSVGGGCIHETFRVEARGGACCVKVNDRSYAEIFDAEADGLRALAGAEVVRVPAVLARGVTEDLAYLAVEWIDLGSPDSGARHLLGEQLAALHRHTNDRYGWHRDNVIGRTMQPNGWSTSWIEFMLERRIGYQLDLAARHGYAQQLQPRSTRLLGELDRILAGHRPAASLLHGDLWGGNWLADTQGRPVLFDPAVHYGDREADIAMTELFGGFGAAFYEAYGAAWPLDDGYAVRRDLYQLYHVLNHLNLFGGGYLASAQRLIDSLLASAGA
jgi:protein-ribulosamine 3-kinase